MAVVLHLTSILLSCWLSDIKFAEAYPTGYDKAPSEAWPSLRSWSSSWKTEGQNVPSQKLSPLLPRSQKPGKSAAGGKVPAEKSKMRDQMASPRALQISIEAAPSTGHGDKNEGHDYPHPHGPSQYHHQNRLESQSRYSSQAGLYKNPGKDSSKPGFHFSISLTQPTTTAAPKPPGVVRVNAGFSHSGTRFNHPYDPVSEDRKPANKIVNFFSTLFDQKGQEHTRAQHDHVYVQPPAPQQYSGHSGTHYQNPTDHWSGHVSGSTEAESGVRKPVHHTVSNSVHPAPQWYPVTSLPPDKDEVINEVLQYARNINGQLMIPLEKCPGFERILEYLNHQHHHHKKHHHWGHWQHHGRPYPHHQGHVQQHSGHGHHEHHYPVQGHHHHHNHHGPKPDYTQFSVNVQGSGVNRQEPTQRPVPGVYPHPYKLWQHTERGQTGGQFGRRDYDVGFNANVDVLKPHSRSQGNVHYVRTGRRSR